MFAILNRGTTVDHKRDRKAKVTCLTCNLKKCTGHCRWESPNSSRATKTRA
jgi:hypothetical protein